MPKGYLSREDMANLQILHTATIHVGAALMSGGGTEPGVGRTLLAELEHYANHTAWNPVPVTTMFGLNEDAGRQLLGGMLVAMALAYGDDVVDDVVTAAAEFLAEHPAGEDSE